MNDTKNTNITWHQSIINRADQEKQSGHRSVALWFTGLSGSGKSTISNAFQKKLFENGHRVYLLDADNLRHGLNSNLGFSLEDRSENIRRVGEVSKLFVDAGVIIMAALISPLRQDRTQIRNLFSAGDFVEIFVQCSLETCQRRDPKGLYQKALNGEIKEFTGISSPYEEPLNPEVIVDSETMSINECVDHLWKYLENQKII